VTCTQYAQSNYDSCCNKGDNPLYCWWQFRQDYKSCFNCCYND
jgi:hypothetical protein